ncbi:DUF453-domain-containing protein [Gonapodya prolifera JEL478]|uniref:DUF453-domain-containing protein n=1 Tax=Gonapodya prolifera (strain JEL478) TaxID=1344416 RepID=A0A139A0W9_GONPJ|nr:DUF453-domain-containing protein [Gonapodya prolifera JEL478]|eukprot:KXS10392.1 DUF453-domain-containing protein [Gonapodya prolifera JEL478]
MPPLRIPAVYMRGGTSKGLFFLSRDLPTDTALRDSILLRTVGSPDPYGKHMDGMGGGSSSTSKVVLLGPSDRADADVAYTFGQVAIDAPVIDWSGNCGNLLAAVGPCALAAGLVRQPLGDGTAFVRIWQTNVKRRIDAYVPVADGDVVEEGDFRMDGVAFPGAEIRLEYLDPDDGASAFPTGNPTDIIHVPDMGDVECTLITSGNPTVVVHATSLGLTGSELQPRINGNPALLQLAERVRAHAAVRMGLVKTAQEATQTRQHTPKLVCVAPPADYVAADGRKVHGDSVDCLVRAFSMGVLHHAVPGTVAVALAAAAKVPTSLVGVAVGNKGQEGGIVRMGHPSGVVEVGAKMEEANGRWVVKKVTMSRSARRIMEGWATMPNDYPWMQLGPLEQLWEKELLGRILITLQVATPVVLCLILSIVVVSLGSRLRKGADNGGVNSKSAQEGEPRATRNSPHIQDSKTTMSAVGDRSAESDVLRQVRTSRDFTDIHKSKSPKRASSGGSSVADALKQAELSGFLGEASVKPDIGPSGATTEEEHHPVAPKSGKELSIFWDIENMPIPAKLLPSTAVQRIRALGGNKPGLSVQIYAIANAHNMKDGLRHDLDICGVSVKDVRIRKPGSADLAIVEYMYQLMWGKTPSQTSVVLISSDKDFASTLNFFESENFDVILCHRRNASPFWKSAVAKTVVWDDLISEDVAAVHTSPTHSATSPAGIAHPHTIPPDVLPLLQACEFGFEGWSTAWVHHSSPEFLTIVRITEMARRVGLVAITYFNNEGTVVQPSAAVLLHGSASGVSSARVEMTPRGRIVVAAYRFGTMAAAPYPEHLTYLAYSLWDVFRRQHDLEVFGGGTCEVGAQQRDPQMTLQELFTTVQHFKPKKAKRWRAFNFPNTVDELAAKLAGVPDMVRDLTASRVRLSGNLLRTWHEFMDVSSSILVEASRDTMGPVNPPSALSTARPLIRVIADSHPYHMSQRQVLDAVSSWIPILGFKRSLDYLTHAIKLGVVTVQTKPTWMVLLTLDGWKAFAESRERSGAVGRVERGKEQPQKLEGSSGDGPLTGSEGANSVAAVKEISNGGERSENPTTDSTQATSVDEPVAIEPESAHTTSNSAPQHLLELSNDASTILVDVTPTAPAPSKVPAPHNAKSVPRGNSPLKKAARIPPYRDRRPPIKGVTISKGVSTGATAESVNTDRQPAVLPVQSSWYQEWPFLLSPLADLETSDAILSDIPPSGGGTPEIFESRDDSFSFVDMSMYALG